MAIIETESFQLGAYMQGSHESESLALVLPGLLDTKDYLHMRTHVDYLAHMGYLALSFDPPGTWESPGDLSLYTASNYLKAINELIELLGNRPTFVMGHSRGATMSVAAAVTNPHVYAFAAVMPSHIRGDYNGKAEEDKYQSGFRHEMRDLPPGDGEKVKELKLPYSFLEDQVAYNYTNDLKKSSKPKLFIYGKQDTTATPERVRAIFEVAGEPKQLEAIESDHNYRYHPQIISQVNELVGKFIASLPLTS